MIWLSFAKWSGSHMSVFSQTRIYRNGWTPFVRVSIRYPLRSFWRGMWPVPVKMEDERG